MLSSRFHADVKVARIKGKPPKHGYQRVIFCWFTNISQPFRHLQYTGKQSPPFYLIHFMIYFFFFFWVDIKCTFYFHFRQTFSDFKFSESYKCRCCLFFFYSYMFSFRCFEHCLKRLSLIHYYNDSYMQTFLYQTFWDFFLYALCSYQSSLPGAYLYTLT